MTLREAVEKLVENEGAIAKRSHRGADAVCVREWGPGKLMLFTPHGGLYVLGVADILADDWEVIEPQEAT
jgi:hypothetical protein